MGSRRERGRRDDARREGTRRRRHCRRRSQMHRLENTLAVPLRPRKSAPRLLPKTEKLPNRWPLNEIDALAVGSRSAFN